MNVRRTGNVRKRARRRDFIVVAVAYSLEIIKIHNYIILGDNSVVKFFDKIYN